MERRIYVFFITALISSLLSVLAAAQATRTAPEGSAASKGAPPGEEQQRLAEFAGSYIATVRTWDDPDSEPTESTLISEQRMIMDGRFLEVDDRSEDGAYHWRAVHSFDASKGHYVSIGMSNRVSRRFSNQSNEFAANRRYLEFISALDDPTTGLKDLLKISNSSAESNFDDNGRWVVIGPAGQQPTFKGVATLTEDGYVYVNYRLGPNGEELGKYREIVYRRRD